MVLYQKATVSQVPLIKELLFKTWTSTYSNLYSPEAIEMVTSLWHSPSLLISQIKDPLVAFVVALDKEKVVGMGNGLYSPKTKSINIQRLHVDPKYQRKGIGSQLMRQIIILFPQAESISLEVEKQNNRAISFYTKLKFIMNGEKVFEVKGIKIPCYVMKKRVPIEAPHETN